MFAPVFVNEERLLKTEPCRNNLSDEQLTCAPNVVPLKVEVPVELITKVLVPGVSFIVPDVSVELPDVTANAFPFKSIIPTYPFSVNPAKLTGISTMKLPAPKALKMATSAAPGTVAPTTPPGVADQFMALFQFPGALAAQYLFAEKEIDDKIKVPKRSKCFI